MARSCDLQLEDNTTSVSCKDLGNLRYRMGSAFIAMVQMLHALHSLWVSLFPFLMLWWNLMLCVTCAKYFSWNRSRLWLPIAGRRLYGNSVPEADSFVETSNAEESLISSHQRGSCADAWHAEKREMSILSFFPRESCAEALHRQGPHFGVFIQAFPHQRGLHTEDGQQRGSSLQDDPVGVCAQAFPHQRGTHKHDAYVDVAARCTDESDAHLLDQLEELVSCGTTSPAEATASDISKLSSLSFLDGRGPQKSTLLKASHWAACSSLLPHQVPLLDICHPPNPQKYSWLQLNLLRNGDMLHLKVPMLINDFSINWSILEQWLQIHNRCSVSCVPAFIRGKDVDYATFQLVLPTIGGSDITSIISLAIAFKWTMEDVESTISESSNLSIHELRSNVAYVGHTCHDGNENSDDGCHRVYGIDDQPNYERDYGLKNEDENSGSDHCEDLGSTSLRSEDGCDVVYGIDVRAIYDRDDGADVIHCRQCDGHEVFYHYNHYHDVEDRGFDSSEDSGDVYGSFVRSNDEVEGLHDRSFRCDVGDDGPRNVEDVDGSCGRQRYDAGDGFYNSDRDLDDDVEDNGDVFSDFDFVDDNGLYGKPLEMELHVAYTWWDEDAVLLDRQEGEEETMEQAWQVV